MAFFKRSYATRRRRHRRRVSRRRHVPAIAVGGRKDWHVFDSGIDDNNLSSTVGYFLMNDITEGTSFSNRIGNRVIMKNIQIRFSLTPGSSQGNSQQMVRLLLVYDRQTNGANLSSPQPLVQSTPWAFKDVNFRERFVIVRDYTIAVGGPAGVLSQYPGEKHRGVHTDMVRCHYPVTYKATAGAVGDIETGGLFFCYVGDTAYTSNNTPVLNVETRVIFQTV